MIFIIIALVLQILLVGPVHLIAFFLRKSSSDRGKFFATSYALFVLWCFVLTTLCFVVPFFNNFAAFFLLIPVVPVAMIIGLGVLYWSLDRLFPNATEAGKTHSSLANIILLLVTLLLLLYLYGRTTSRSIPVPVDIQGQKSDFEAQIKASGGTMNP